MRGGNTSETKRSTPGKNHRETAEIHPGPTEDHSKVQGTGENENTPTNTPTVNRSAITPTRSDTVTQGETTSGDSNHNTASSDSSQRTSCPTSGTNRLNGEARSKCSESPADEKPRSAVSSTRSASQTNLPLPHPNNMGGAGPRPGNVVGHSVAPQSSGAVSTVINRLLRDFMTDDENDSDNGDALGTNRLASAQRDAENTDRTRGEQNGVKDAHMSAASQPKVGPEVGTPKKLTTRVMELSPEPKRRRSLEYKSDSMASRSLELKSESKASRSVQLKLESKARRTIKHEARASELKSETKRRRHQQISEKTRAEVSLFEKFTSRLNAAATRPVSSKEIAAGILRSITKGAPGLTPPGPSAPGHSPFSPRPPDVRSAPGSPSSLPGQQPGGASPRPGHPSPMCGQGQGHLGPARSSLQGQGKNNRQRVQCQTRGQPKGYTPLHTSGGSVTIGKSTQDTIPLGVQMGSFGTYPLMPPPWTGQLPRASSMLSPSSPAPPSPYRESRARTTPTRELQGNLRDRNPAGPDASPLTPQTPRSDFSSSESPPASPNSDISPENLALQASPCDEESLRKAHSTAAIEIVPQGYHDGSEHMDGVPPRGVLPQAYSAVSRMRMILAYAAERSPQGYPDRVPNDRLRHPRFEQGMMGETLAVPMKLAHAGQHAYPSESLPAEHSGTQCEPQAWSRGPQEPSRGDTTPIQPSPSLPKLPYQESPRCQVCGDFWCHKHLAESYYGNIKERVDTINHDTVVTHGYQENDIYSDEHDDTYRHDKQLPEVLDGDESAALDLRSKHRNVSVGIQADD